MALVNEGILLPVRAHVDSLQMDMKKKQLLSHLIQCS